MSSTPGQTIVLIHGMWMTSLSWEHWAERYRNQGHTVVAESWLGLDREPAELRRDPSPLKNLSITDAVDNYEKIIRGLDRPPIIIGHSFGGLFTQLLADRGLGSAAVALGTAAPKGVLKLPYSTLRTAWPALRNPANRKKEIPLTLEQFHWCFTNSLSREASDAVYERYYIPGAGTTLLPGRARELQPEGCDEGRLPQPLAAAAALAHRRGGPHLPTVGQQRELQEAASRALGNRAPRVSGPLPLPGPGRLGGSRRPRPVLDDRALEGPVAPEDLSARCRSPARGDPEEEAARPQAADAVARQETDEDEAAARAAFRAVRPRACRRRDLPRHRALRRLGRRNRRRAALRRRPRLRRRGCVPHAARVRRRRLAHGRAQRAGRLPAFPDRARRPHLRPADDARHGARRLPRLGLRRRSRRAARPRRDDRRDPRARRRRACSSRARPSARSSAARGHAVRARPRSAASDGQRVVAAAAEARGARRSRRSTPCTRSPTSSAPSRSRCSFRPRAPRGGSADALRRHGRSASTPSTSCRSEASSHRSQSNGKAGSRRRRPRSARRSCRRSSTSASTRRSSAASPARA